MSLISSNTEMLSSDQPWLSASPAGGTNAGTINVSVNPAGLSAGTYTGTVTAASDWGGPAERRNVRRALPGSWEELLHGQRAPAFLVDTRELHGRRLERAIGVVYRPEAERISHYF